MLVYDSTEHYLINGDDIYLFDDETSYGHNTVAEYDGNYYFLGNELVNIETAIGVWQEANGRLLSIEEIHNCVKYPHRA